jgi:hypothetical protein
VSILTTLTAGDSLRLSIPSRGRTVADGWALTLLLVPSAAAGVRISASTSAADPDDPAAHLLTVAAATTAAWAPGAYTWALQASRGAERETMATGQITVRPDPAAAGTAAMDLRSTSRQALDALNAYLLDASNLKAASYSIAGRSLARHAMADLLALRSRLQAEVAREDAAATVAAGGFDRRRIFVRFGA